MHGVGLLSLAIGMFGYHFLERLPWLDSLLNASMILGGMGPVDQLHTRAGKLFASGFYAQAMMFRAWQDVTEQGWRNQRERRAARAIASSKVSSLRVRISSLGLPNVNGSR